MAFSSCSSHYLISSSKADNIGKRIRPWNSGRTDQKLILSHRSSGAEIFGQQVVTRKTNSNGGWSFMGGSRIIVTPELERLKTHRTSSKVSASWIANSQIATNVFGLGTIAVLPFYALMVIAPKSELTRKSMQSSLPYAVLGVLYAYLLYLSWTPETIKMIFSSKYLLPELQSIAKMFSSEMTLASAWIHLLVVDLFAARQVFHDGQENQIETRHSVSLCLLFCPIGVLSHFVTKALTRTGAGSF